MANKQIKDFNPNLTPQGTDLYLVQRSDGTTLNITQENLLLDVNTGLFSLYTQITNNYSDLISISGYLQAEINNLDLNYATDSSLAAVSGYLQKEIDNNRSEVISVSGNLYSIIVDVSGSLQNQVDNNYSSLIEISGYVQSQPTRNSFVVTELNTPLDIVSTSYNSAKWSVSISGSFGLRMSEVMAITNGILSEYTETSTVDIGNTSLLSLSVGLSGTSLVLYASSSAGDWFVKYMRYAL